MQCLIKQGYKREECITVVPVDLQHMFWGWIVKKIRTATWQNNVDGMVHYFGLSKKV